MTPSLSASVLNAPHAPFVALGENFRLWLQGVDLTNSEKGDNLALLRTLYTAGRQSLPFARLLEGHIDAVQILYRTLGPADRSHLETLLESGASLGVWNADLPGAPLSLINGTLSGGKAFASGAGILSHALVTLNAGDKDRVQLLLLDLTKVPPEIDTTWWNVIGMQASETHIVRWNGAISQSDWKVGEPGDYENEPWFSGGALRFVAAQAGAIAALFDGVRDHLIKTGRDQDVHQTDRLADLYACADISAALVRHTASCSEDAVETKLARVAHTRTVVCDQAEHAILLAQQCVGVKSMFRDHPLSDIICNLMVYLRQPAPDAQKQKVGRAAAAGVIQPQL